MEIIQEKEEELENYKENLQEKDNRILELENEIVHLKSELNNVNKKLEETQAECPEDKDEKSISWMRVTKEKDKKIEQLESEVRKQTSNLQGIVNKELWDKNREIEKLQNRFTEKIKLKEQEITELEKEVTAKSMQLTMLKEKISELGIQVNLPSSLVANLFTVPPKCTESSEEITMIKDQLKNSNEECKYLHKTVDDLRQKLRNTPERERDSRINQLKIDHEKLQKDFEKSEKLRQETVNLCSILTTRLEELAHFLDSLLKHRSVLGMLGSKQRSAIKQAVDQSLDLSKSLSMSIMNEEQCLAQLSSITGVLNTSDNSVYNASLSELLPIGEYSTSLTFNSHLNKNRGDGECNNDKVKDQSDIIEILRAQIETMKKEIEIRDMELGKQNNFNIPVSTDENKSLRNDLDLVNCIIDLQNKSSCFTRKADVMSPEKIYHNLVANKSCPAIMKTYPVDQNCSESEAWSEPDRCVSQARIGLDCEVLKSTSCNLNRSRSNRSEISARGTSEESTEEELSGVANLRTPSKRGSTGSVETRHTIATLQEKLGLLENKLREKDNEILSLKTSILELDNKSLELKLNMSEEVAKLRNEKIDIEKLLKETEEKFKNVDLNNDEMLVKLEEMEKERDFALSSLEKYTHQVDVFESKTRQLELILEEKQQEYNNNLAAVEAKWQSYLEKQKLDLSELRTKEINDIKNQYEKDWIHKNDWNKQITEMKLIYNEMEQIKNLLKSSESKIYIMEQAEQDLKRRLAESEDSNREKIISLKRELNESTLRASQAALERTKVSNEKLKLEAEIRKLEIREATKSNELEEQQKEYNNMKNNLQKQITQCEQQKSLLQLKVSELEALNAELHNRLVKLQTSDNVWSGNNSLSNTPKISDLITNFKNLGRFSLDTRSNVMRQRNGYTSEEFAIDESNNCFNRSAPETYHWLHQNVNHNANEAVDARVATNSSPDLGIESDQGRFSSLETNVTTTTRPLLQTLELTASMNNLLSANQVDNIGHCKYSFTVCFIFK